MNKTLIDSYSPFLDKLKLLPQFRELHKLFSSSLADPFDPKKNGNLYKWFDAFEKLPDIESSEVNLNKATPEIIAKSPLSMDEQEKLVNILKEFHPWRKGPFNLFGIDINTEWRSDFKWDRVKNISSLKDRTVLDIGCGNGYHCFRMVGDGAKMVVGVDTGILSILQFKVFQKYSKMNSKIEIFPISVDHITKNIKAFDTVFSMGVIYHRKDPIDHLQQIKGFLRDGGEVILESLVVDGDEDTILYPKKRYAQMRNVWQIPSHLAMEKWLKHCGFCNIRTIDISETSLLEQRATDWMTFHSLENFLDPSDPSKTIEGYPAPKRAIIVANIS